MLNWDNNSLKVINERLGVEGSCKLIEKVILLWFLGSICVKLFNSFRVLYFLFFKDMKLFFKFY